MRRELKGFMAGVITTLMFTSATLAIAEGYTQSIDVTVDQTKVAVNSTIMPGHTILWNNQTYIPLRETLEAVGCTVNYDASTQTANVVTRPPIGHTTAPIMSFDGRAIPGNYTILSQEPDGYLHFYIDAMYLANLYDLDFTRRTYNGYTTASFLTPMNTPHENVSDTAVTSDYARLLQKTAN